MRCDVLFVNARVLDPETGLDATGAVGVSGERIVLVEPGRPPVEATTVVDAGGQVLAPGFIDLHSHAHSATSLRLQSLDGVTTSLDLEGGALPGARVRARMTAEGRPINFGFSAGWALARMHLYDGMPLTDGTILDWARNSGLPNWQRVVDRPRRRQLLDLLAQEVAAGAIGIGVLAGYAPNTGRDEYFDLARLAAELDTPLFTHTRFISREEPSSSLEAVSEVVAAAAGSGAHLHLCHLNSTSNHQIDDITAMIARARAYGLRLTTEAYPYGSAATVASAAFLDPDNLSRIGIAPRDVYHLASRTRPPDAAALRALRATHPGSLVIWDWLDEHDPAQRAVLARSLTFADTAFASDAVWLTDPTGNVAGESWPPSRDVLTHPRSTGCFAKTLRWVVRELGLLPLPEVVRRASLLPARILEDAAPAMRRKGRVRVGADADLILFDPDTVADRATYDDSVRPSHGFSQVMVNGVFVVKDGEPVLDALPGKAIMGAVR